MYGVQKSIKIGSSSSSHKPIHSNNLSLNNNCGFFDSNCVKLATPTYAGMSSSAIYEEGKNNNNNTRTSSFKNEKGLSSLDTRVSINSLLLNK